MLFKKLFLTIFLMSMLSSAGAQSAADTVCHEVLLATTMGNIRVKLYNDTPLHRDNFLKLVRAGFYDGMLFHRVIANFMIQTGDPKSREAHTGEVLGNPRRAKRFRLRFVGRSIGISVVHWRLPEKAMIPILNASRRDRSSILSMASVSPIWNSTRSSDGLIRPPVKR